MEGGREDVRVYQKENEYIVVYSYYAIVVFKKNNSTLLNCTLKMAKMVNFVLCGF